jgi:hypothetical protein
VKNDKKNDFILRGHENASIKPPIKNTRPAAKEAKPKMSVKLNNQKKEEMEASRIKPNAIKETPKTSGIMADLSNVNLDLILLAFFELICCLKWNVRFAKNVEFDTSFLALIVAKLVVGIRQFMMIKKKKAKVSFIFACFKDLKI